MGCCSQYDTARKTEPLQVKRNADQDRGGKGQGYKGSAAFATGGAFHRSDQRKYHLRQLSTSILHLLVSDTGKGFGKGFGKNGGQSRGKQQRRERKGAGKRGADKGPGHYNKRARCVFCLPVVLQYLWLSALTLP